MPTTTIAIVHPREIIRLGLMAVLKGQAGIKVLAEASNPKDAPRIIKQTSPSLVLLFDQFESDASFDLAKKLHGSNPGLKVLMIGVEPSQTYMARASTAGVQDYLFEGSTGRQILEAIKRAAEGKSPPGTTAYGQVLASMQNRSSNPSVGLTPRELQVLRHIGYGLSNEEIAQSLGISVETVKEHVQNILRKMGVSDRTNAAVWAVKQGLV